MKLSVRLVATIAAFGALIMAQSLRSANAATIVGELHADPGSYAPIALGESVALDGCGSVFDYDQDPLITSTTVSICNGSTDISIFDFTWTVYDLLGGGVELGVLAANSVNPVMTTGGIGDLITTAGTYVLSLNVTVSPSNTTFALPDGNTASVQPELFGPNPDSNSDTAFQPIHLALTVNPATVPEPSAALLLIPGLIYMARRQRRIKRQA